MSRIRALAAASVFALALPGTSCSVDVYDGYRDDRVDLPLYPNARPVQDDTPAGTNVSFAGNFSDTNVVRQTFESDDTPERILDFYRAVLRARGAMMECRGTIHVRRRRGGETLVCVQESPSAPRKGVPYGSAPREGVPYGSAPRKGVPYGETVRLAGGVYGRHSIVAVIPNGRFALLRVRTGR